MTRRTSIAAAALLMLGGLQVAPAVADTGSAEIVNLIHTEIPVVGNGSVYQHVPPTTAIQGYIRVRLDAGTSGRIKWFSTWWGFGNADALRTQWTSYRDDGVHKNFGNDRPKEWDETILVSVPSVSFKDQAIGECNKLADRLRQQGLSDHQIFAQDRTIDMGLQPGLDYEMSGIEGNALQEGSAAFQTIKLVCRKWDGNAVPQAATRFDSLPPVVKQASLVVLEHATLVAGRCRITLSGVIETSAPNVAVSFRYKDDAGNQSKVHDVITDHAGIAMFSHDYDVPINPNAAESGKIRIVGVSHGFHSAKQGYHMDCTEPRFEALMPPTVEIDVVPVDKIKVGQQVCYSKVKLYAKVQAQNAALSGTGIFIGDYYVSQPQPYDIEAGETILLGGDRALDWTPDPQAFEAAAPSPQDQPKQQTIKIGFNLANANDTVVASVPMKPYTIKCYFPTLNPGVMGGAGGLSAAPRTNPVPAPGAAQRRNPQMLALALDAPLADLLIQQAEPGNNENRLRVRVVNGGPGDAGATKLKAVYRRDGKNLVRMVPVQALKAGAKTIVVVDFGQPVAEARRISLTVDPQDQVKEQKEQNNTLQFKG